MISASSAPVGLPRLGLPWPILTILTSTFAVGRRRFTLSGTAFNRRYLVHVTRQGLLEFVYDHHVIEAKVPVLPVRSDQVTHRAEEEQ